MRTARKQNRGFTLIELLVVVAIIGILMGILLPVLMKARTSARVSGAKDAMRAMVMAMERYREDFRHYPMPDTVYGNSGSNSTAGSQALALYLCTRFKWGEMHYGPYLDNVPPSRFQGAPNTPLALVSPLNNNRYLYSNIWDVDGVMRGYLIVDPGLDGQEGGSIGTGSATQPTPIPAWTSDGTTRDQDNIFSSDKLK